VCVGGFRKVSWIKRYPKGKVKSRAEDQKGLTAQHCIIQKDDAGLNKDYLRVMPDDV
jgi:hypothetical protein